MGRIIPALAVCTAAFAVTPAIAQNGESSAISAPSLLVPPAPYDSETRQSPSMAQSKIIQVPQPPQVTPPEPPEAVQPSPAIPAPQPPAVTQAPQVTQPPQVTQVPEPPAATPAPEQPAIAQPAIQDKTPEPAITGGMEKAPEAKKPSEAAEAKPETPANKPTGTAETTQNATPEPKPSIEANPNVAPEAKPKDSAEAKPGAPPEAKPNDSAEAKPKEPVETKPGSTAETKQSDVADAKPTDGADGRFTFSRMNDGYVRLDNRTGQVSFCGKRSVGWTCQLAPDDRGVLENEIARLQEENVTLKRDLLARGLPLPGTVKPEPQPRTSQNERAPFSLPHDPNIERMKVMVEKVWRQLVDMITALQKDVLKKS